MLRAAPDAVYPNAPASTPVRVGDTVSAEEAAARMGTLRSEDVGDNIFQRAPFQLVQYGSFYPFQHPVGVVTRAPLHPAGPVGTLHDSGWNYQGGSVGLHGEMVLTSTTPDGEQQAFGVAPKTWRAEPNPWDADVFTGWRPADPGAD